MAISAGPTGPFVLSLSKDRLRVFSLIEIANPPHRVRGCNDKVRTRHCREVDCFDGDSGLRRNPSIIAWAGVRRKAQDERQCLVSGLHLPLLRVQAVTHPLAQRVGGEDHD